VDVTISRIEELKTELIKDLCIKAEMKIDKINGKFFNDEKNIFLVAFDEKSPCGFLYGYLLECFQTERPYMFLYSIDVFDGYKRRGVGEKLIEKLKDIAVKYKCSEIFVLTNDSNDAAKGLYEKIGAIRENMDDVMYVYNIE